MKKILYLSLIFTVVLQFNSCKKEKEGPSITSFILLPNDTIPFVPGVYNKYSFDVTSEEGISSYAIAIIPKKNHTNLDCYITGHKNLDLATHYSVMDSIWVPDICYVGEYTFQLGCTNKSGYSSEMIKSFTTKYQLNNPLSINMTSTPSSNASFENGDTIRISAIVMDSISSLSRIEVLIKDQREMQSGYEDAIFMLKQEDFSDNGNQGVNASIIVGAENDNNSPASAIQNWDIQNAYIVLRAYNTEGFVKYSDHYNIQINDTLQ